MSLFSFDFFSIEDSQVKKKEEKKIEKRFRNNNNNNKYLSHTDSLVL